MYSCVYKRVELVKFLIAKGADKRVVTGCGRTLFILAAIAGNIEIATDVFIKELLDACDQFGKNAIKYATEHENMDIVSFILTQINQPETLMGNNRNIIDMHLQYENGYNVPGHKSLEELLREYGLEKYWTIFKSNNITLMQFLHMTEPDMKQIGISTLGARRKLSRLILNLKIGV
ncbi:uncharacterized protein LOC106674136 isoform X2 [Cimex lectularius]|nr:uncharacterized protein LOC106674136 isoform X2 [Cimex lectularius]